MRVHVAGNVCIDTTFRIDRFPHAGETLNAISHSDGLGGKGANQAVAATRTGAAVMLWAAIGRDANGAIIREMLAGQLDVTGLTAFDLPTDRSTVAVDAKGENIIVSGVDCALAFDPLRQTRMLDVIQPGDIFVVQGNLDDTTTKECLRAAQQKGARTVFNASPLAPRKIVDLSSVDVVIVNEGEAHSISRFKSPQHAAAELIDLGAGSVIITLGARGCLFLAQRGGEPVRIEAPKVVAIDTSGAGDVLCGVFAGCLASGMAPQSCLRVGVAASALAVTRAGTLASCPTAAEILNLMTSETEHA